MLRKINEVLYNLPTSNAAIKNTASNKYIDGYYPAFSASGQDVFLPEYRFDQKGLVVSAVGARCGKVFRADGKWNVCANTHALGVNEEIADRDYCWYLINNESWWIKGGTAQPFVKVKASFDRFHDFPNINKQREIVKKLNLLQEAIKIRKGQIEKLDELVKARFVEMFGDIIVNNRNWSTATWNDVVAIKNGKNQKRVENPDGEFAICGSGGVMGRANNYITNENSVIIGRKGNINKPILMREKFWNVDTAFGIEPLSEKVMVDFLYVFCIMFNFEKLNKAVTIPSLTKSDLLQIEMPLPPAALQRKFSIFVAQVDKSKFAIQKSLEKTQQLFDSLMQEYFG